MTLTLREWLQKWCCVGIVTGAAVLASTPASADLVGSVNVLAAWTRPAGSYSDIETPERGKVVAIDPYTQVGQLRTRKMFDMHYGDVRTYRGAPLAQFVKAYAKGRSTLGSDRVILHFDNGMRVPIDLAALKELDAFVAVESCDLKGKHCSTAFEEAPHGDIYGTDEDPRPIQFSWNKLVVAKAWHPATHEIDQKGFSPWRHVDTLVGLEFVDAVAYEAQFAVGNTGGEQVFFKRCQYCHGARQVGARLGWDFVTPLALYEKRAPGDLLNHVKYPKAMAQRLGLQMPPQKDVAGSEVDLLWRWMRDVAKKPIRPYRP